MGNGFQDLPTSILQLPNDCLYMIFDRFSSCSDRESFGLTCRRLLQIQNSSRRSLQFRCSFAHLSISSLSRPSVQINEFHLSKLLSRFQKLQSLSLSGCIDLADAYLYPLESYGTSLQMLHLDCCFGLTDYGFAFIASGCPSLIVISLYRCNITDAGLITLSKHCLGLKDVNLSYCSHVTDHGVSHLSHNCRLLRAVRISYCRNITGKGFQGCSQTLSYLEADSCCLQPEGIQGITSGGGLEYMSLVNLSWRMHGDSLTAIGAGFVTNLRALNFSGGRTIGNDSIIAISKGCPLLSEWSLVACHEIKILGWESIASNCHNLEKLHVNRCRNLCDQSLLALRHGCRRLSILYVSHCRRLSSASLETFKCLRCDVEILHEEVPCSAPNWAFQLS